MRMPPRLGTGLASATLGVLLLTAPTEGQETTRVSVDSAGAEGNQQSSAFAASALSADGRFIAFQSFATNLVAGDTNNNIDVFVRDRATGVTERVSVDSSGAESNGGSHFPAISADGQYVAFMSSSSNLVSGDTNGSNDVFVHDRLTGATERVSIDSSGGEATGNSEAPAISADGRVVAFISAAADLVAGDTNVAWDVFVHDRSTGITERVSVDSTGAEGNYGAMSLFPAISSDGQVVAFESGAFDLVAGDTNAAMDVFVHDRATGITERVSVGSNLTEADSDSQGASISADGQIVAFHSAASNLVAGDTNVTWDVFVHDRTTGSTERVSVDSSGAQANNYNLFPAITPDGQIVAFESYASNLVAGDTNGTNDAFVHDRTTGSTERVSVDSSGAQATGLSGRPSLDADGRIVSFFSFADDLVAGDTNGHVDVFIHDECGAVASWSNYGAGFPGTYGIPALTSQQYPVIGTTITLDLANSYAQPTFGLLFIGFTRTSIHSAWGGDLLVVPALTLFVTFSFGGDSFTGNLPDDASLCGSTVDLQAIEADPGAAKGVSFTQGLELVLGH